MSSRGAAAGREDSELAVTDAKGTLGPEQAT